MLDHSQLDAVEGGGVSLTPSLVLSLCLCEGIFTSHFHFSLAGSGSAESVFIDVCPREALGSK